MGKGSHVVLKLGDTRTIVRNPKDELKTGTYYAKLKQLGLSDKDRGALKPRARRHAGWAGEQRLCREANYT
jgi:hypothetical protein